MTFKNSQQDTWALICSVKTKSWKNSSLLSGLVANSLTVTRGMQQEHIQW